MDQLSATKHIFSKEFHHQYNMYYEETFAQVTKINIIHTLIVVAFICQCHISQIDDKNDFLNGNLQEAVFMVPLLRRLYLV